MSRDRLVDELWGDSPPETAVASVQVYVSRLRKVLADGMLVTQAPGYVLRVDPERVDSKRFERLVKERQYEDALALWRGPPLAEFAYEPFAQAEIARLEELRLAALEERVEADLARRRHAELVGELERLIADHPLRERLRGQLMLALYRSGRQAEALEAYQAARRTLVDELGIEPGAPLQRLEKEILVHDPELDLARAGEAAGRSPTFVGRDAELRALVAALEEAVAGQGRLYLLAGEPGIGKSRLAEEVSAQASALGARILVGRCWEAGGAPAYWPWVQALRAYAGHAEPAALRSQLGAGAADVAQIVPELRDRFLDLSDPPAVDADAARFRLFDAVSELLRRAGQDRPIVLVLDDLHAADTASLLLLRFVARQLASARVLIVGTYRDVDPVPAPPLTETLAAVTREPVTRRLALRGLEAPEVARYVELTAAEIASRELAAAVHAETEGNPFFVGEIVRLLAVEGVAAEGAPIAIPRSVKDVIEQRLAHLSESSNRLLVLACVLGREFAVSALARLADTGEHELLKELDEAMEARVLADVPATPGRLRFAHVLIRDTLYDDLTAVRRVRLHRQAAATLEALHGDDPGPFLAELAHHAVAGHDFEKSHRYAQRAAERALGLLAYEESARLYETALETLELSGTADEELRCELLLGLGEARARGGDVPAARRAFADAADLAQRLGFARALGRAAAGYGGRILWGRGADDPRLVPLLEAGLAALGDADIDLRVRLLGRLAGALRDEPSRERRDRLSREAVELARRSEDQGLLAYALDARAGSILGPDTIEECLALGTELRGVANAIGDKERAVAAQTHRFIAHVQLGEIRQADLDDEEGLQVAEELRQPAQLWQIVGGQALLAIARGRLDEGERLSERARELGERAQPGGAVAVHRMQRYMLSDFRGGLEEMEPSIAELVAEYPTRPVFRCVLACVHARLGRVDEAKRALADFSRETFVTLPFDQEWLFGMSFLAETAALVADAESAPALYDLLLPWASLNAVDVSEGMRGSVSRYLALLAVTDGRSADAEHHFEAALAANEQMGLRPWLALTQTDYARTVAARAGSGDLERAADLLRAALATYHELGMESHADEATALCEAVISKSRAP